MSLVEVSPMKRQKGTGHLFRRGNMWYLRYRYHGGEIVKTTGVVYDDTDPIAFAKSKGEANEVLMKETEILRLRDRKCRLRVMKVMLESVSEQIKDRLSEIAKDAPIERLAEVFTKSARRIDCSKEQMKVYVRYIGELRRVTGAGVAVSSIDEMMAEQIAEELAKGRSPNSYNKYLNGLTLIWDAVGSRFGCDVNPWKNMPRKRLDTVVRSDLTDGEIDALMANAKGEMRTLIAIGLYTGMRMGDCAMLTWDRIRDGVVCVKTSKTGADVAIPVHPKLAEALGEAGDDGEYVVPEIAGIYRASNSSLSRKVRALFVRSGIATNTTEQDGRRSRPIRSFHSLRHSFTSRCIASGVPPHIVQALVGHTNAKMTEHYTHLKDEQFLAAFKGMK